MMLQKSVQNKCFREKRFVNIDQPNIAIWATFTCINVAHILIYWYD